MKKKFALVIVAAIILASSHLAHAQDAKKLFQLGVLYPGLSGASAPMLDGLRQGLRELGYTDGKNILINYRFAEGRLDPLPDLAAELVRLKVDVIVAAGGTPAILAAKKATTTIPIVFPVVNDPVAQGFVDSLARPGGNLTGFTNRTPELGGKMLELLKEAVPRAKQVAVLGQVGNPSQAFDLKNLQVVAPALGVQLHHIEVRSSDDFDSAFSKIAGTVRANALYLQATALFLDNGKRIAELATKHRLPAMSFARELTEAGILASYGADRFDLGRRTATYVDKILKGAKPSELPVQQPMKFEFVVNLKTAKQIGVTIPPNVLVRADKVIR